MQLYLPCHEIDHYVRATKHKEEIFTGDPSFGLSDHLEGSLIGHQYQYARYHENHQEVPEMPATIWDVIRRRSGPDAQTGIGNFHEPIYHYVNCNSVLRSPLFDESLTF